MSLEFSLDVWMDCLSLVYLWLTTLALVVVVFRYRPTLPVSYVQSQLAFAGTEQCVSFLTLHDVKFSDSARTLIDAKISSTSLRADVNHEGLAGAKESS